MENRNINTPPRFVKGKLVMLSRKNTASGAIPYYRNEAVEKAVVAGAAGKKTSLSNAHRHSVDLDGRLERGIPILLTETPEIVSKENLSFIFFYGLRERRANSFFWRVSFLLNEQVYQMFLTNRQYNHELVKAVQLRLTKDYTNGASQVRF